MHRTSSAVAARSKGSLTAVLLLLVLVSPAVTELSARSLVVHHVAHWTLVVAGALLGYELRDRFGTSGRAAAAWVGLGAAFFWHLPPTLTWTDNDTLVHVAAHATLLAGGLALGWSVPALGGQSKAALFIAGNLLMWPVVLAEITGAFAFRQYPGQSAIAGVAEMAAMAAAWVVFALWGPLRSIAGRPAVAGAVQITIGGFALLDWLAR